MIKQSAFAIAGLLLAAAVPAAAAEKGTGAAPGNEVTSVTASRGAAAEKKYCVDEMLTGSRIPYRVCRTKAEWAAEGVDIERR